METFSWMAAFGGVVGVIWLELMRIVSRISRRQRLWYGLKKWQYGLIVGGFVFVAVCFAGFSGSGFISAVFIGFGVEGGPVATGILGSGAKPSPKVEDGPIASSSFRAGLREFFTEP